LDDTTLVDLVAFFAKSIEHSADAADLSACRHCRWNEAKETHIGSENFASPSMSIARLRRNLPAFGRRSSRRGVFIETGAIRTTSPRERTD
jgi:hypothetical protein